MVEESPHFHDWLKHVIVSELVPDGVMLMFNSTGENMTFNTDAPPINFERGNTNFLIYNQEEARPLTVEDTVTIPVNLAVDLLDLVRAAKTQIRPEINRVHTNSTTFEQLALRMYYEKLIVMTQFLADAVRTFDKDNFEEEMGS